MNFTGMPLLEWRYGYPVVVAVSVLVVAAHRSGTSSEKSGFDKERDGRRPVFSASK